MPAEFGMALKPVTKYLSKNAAWLPEPPFMEEAGLRGVRALKALCARTIDLNSVDERAAVDGSRPLEES